MNLVSVGTVGISKGVHEELEILVDNFGDSSAAQGAKPENFIISKFFSSCFCWK